MVVADLSSATLVTIKVSRRHPNMVIRAFERVSTARQSDQEAWDRDRGLARTRAVAVMCLGVAALRPAPFILGLALVVILSIPWVLAVMLRLNGETGSPAR